MENLWAPWRIRYLVREQPEGCFLCHYSKSADDVKNHVLIRDRNCFAVLNGYPYNPGHLMVATYKHTGDLASLSEQELMDVTLLVVRCQQILTRAMKPHGFNIGLNLGRAAGAGIPDHLHWHIVPRWEGDANFMPVIGDTRVIPQALDDSYTELKKHV